MKIVIKMQKINSVLINISVMAVAIIIFLLIFEFALWVFYPQDLNPFTMDERIWLKGKPYFKGTYTRNEFNTTIRLNSLGFRDDTDELEDYRILVLGDSFTFGYGVEGNEIYPKILETLLEEKLNKNITIINAGVPGVGADYYLNFIKKEGIKLNPNLVIVGFFMGNDITDTLKSHSFYRTINNTLCHKEEIRISKVKRLRSFMSSHSDLYNFIKNRVYYTPIRKVVNNLFDVEKKEQNNPGFEFFIYNKTHSGLIEEGFRNTELIIEEMNNYLKKRNIRIIVVIIPLQDELSKEMRESVADKFELSEPAFDYPRERIISFLKKEGIDYLDLKDYFKESEKYYYKIDKHWNKEGHMLAAELIFKEIANKDIIN